ncbi:MAG: hypothetical protein EXR59_03090 [Dehalococcoidia bacterium]|nr:hypothetical protein [Dehalococcoidia bacterium]
MLAKASKNGVEVCAYTCAVFLESIEIQREVPVNFKEES